MIQRLAFAIMVALMIAACGGADGSPTVAGPLKVVATFSVLGDIAQNVGGDKIELRTLVGPGIDTHTFAPSPADNRALAEAALVLENGLGFEGWLDDLYSASGSKAARVVVTDGIAPLEADGETDPHAWHNVANAIRMAENIRDALAAADPANAATYRSNAESYIAELQTLDAWVFDEVERVPEERRKLVTTHDTFGYFAERYGFEIVGAVLPSSTEGASPSAQEVAALVEAVRSVGVPAVFAENVSSNSLLNQIAAEAGIAVVASLYTDALGPPGSDSDTYLKMMQYNVATIVRELSK